jgi:hypothetical protein
MTSYFLCYLYFIGNRPLVNVGFSLKPMIPHLWRCTICLKISSEEREQMLKKDRAQIEDVTDKFIDIVFNSHDAAQPSSAVTTTNVVLVFDDARGLLNNQDPNSSLFLANTTKFSPRVQWCLFGFAHVRCVHGSWTHCPSMAHDPSSSAFQCTKLSDPYLRPIMNDVRYDDTHHWLQDEPV